MKLTYRPCPTCGTTAALPDGQRWCGFCKRGYAAGVQAARDAVAALPHDTYCVTRDENYQRPCNCPVDDALAAIDALKEKP